MADEGVSTTAALVLVSLCFSCVATISASLPEDTEQRRVPLYVWKARRYLERQKAYERTMQARMAALSQAAMAFTSQLYLHHITGNDHGNVLISPLGAYTSLAMTLTASRGRTKKEVLAALSLKGEGRGIHTSLQRVLKSLQDDDTDDVNDDISDLGEMQNDDAGIPLSLEDLESIVRNDYLMDSSISYNTGQSHIRYSTAVKTGSDAKPQSVSKSGPDLSVRLANAMFHSEEVALSQHFSNRLVSLYGAPPMAMQQEEPEVSANLWVDAVTRGTVPDMLAAGSVTEETLLVLVSAFSFWGAWETNFDEKETVPVPFQTLNGDSIITQSMYRPGNYSLKNLDNVQAKVLELPYANTRYSLYVFLPHVSIGLHELEQSLKAHHLQTLVHDMPEPSMTIVLLPKFRLRSRISLTSELQSLGVKRLFKKGKADLRRMTDERLYVNEFFQYTAFEVNEGKTTNIETNHVKLGTGKNLDDNVTDYVNNEYEDDYFYEDYVYSEEAGEGESGDYFIADKPFLFMVRDKKYDLVLLMGRVTHPMS